MPIASPSAKVARLVAEPGVEWKPETTNRDLTDGAWTFDVAELTAHSAFMYTTISLEAAEDVVGLDQVINNSFAQQLSLAFDQAGLSGDGANQPLGLSLMTHAQDRVLESTAVGVLGSYKPFIKAMGLIKAAHYEPSSILMPVEAWTALNSLADADENPLQRPPAYKQLTEYVSSFLPTDGGAGTNELTLIVGDLSAMTFGVRTDLTLEVSRTGAGFKKGSIEIRGYLRFGMYVERPEAICVLRGATVPAGA
jgi:HK97 family phage major capsid protein